MADREKHTGAGIREGVVPSFFWDRNVSEERLRAALANPEDPDHIPYLQILLREARVSDVWKYVTPMLVSSEWELLSPGLGRRRDFWEWLLGAWRERGFLQ